MYIGKKLCVVLVVRVLLKWKLSDLHPTSLQEWLSVTKIVKIKKTVLKNHIFIYLRPLVLLRINYNIYNAICT